MDILHDQRKRDNKRWNIWSAVSLFTVSASVIFLQVVLARAISLLQYHHFSYFVISTTLLGFGASGTLLAVMSGRFLRSFHAWVFRLKLLYCIVIPVCYVTATAIPIDIQYVFFSRRQCAYLLVYKLLLLTPFLLGATIIGLMLMYYRDRAGVVYGVNLLGSGCGGILAMLSMSMGTALQMPSRAVILAWIGLCGWIGATGKRMYTGSSMAGLLVATAPGIAILTGWWHVPSAIDPHKALSHLNRLQRQGDAELVVSRNTRRGQIDIFDSPSVHHTLFAGLTSPASAPRQLTLLFNGNHAGSIFDILDRGEAAILDATPQSLAYRLVASPQNVLLLGEVTGASVWLAKRFNADKVVVANRHNELMDIMKGRLYNRGGHIFAESGVEVVNEDPRLYIERTKESFDIIHIVADEGMSAGTSGLMSLHENYLLTVESIRKCFARLTDRGMITITRGVQYPPRDNVKVFALFARSASAAGANRPGHHLALARNYLAVTTLLTRQAFAASSLPALDSALEHLTMDIDYHPLIERLPDRSFNLVPVSADTDESYYRIACRRLLSDDADRFFDEWVYNVKPPTDNSPYFYNFFRWQSLNEFINTYGSAIFRKLELGYVVLIACLVEAVLTAFFIIMLPLFLVKANVTSKRKWQASVYFLCIGLAFMFVEMVLINRFTRLLGDPIHALSVVLTAILVFAGAGSMVQARLKLARTRQFILAFVVIGTAAVLLIAVADDFISWGIRYGEISRSLLVTIVIAPMATAMGFMFPIGIAALENRYQHFVAWAWGLNGFASVTAAPLAVLFSMEFGFRFVVVSGLFLYLVAGCALIRFEKSHFATNA